MSIFTSLETDFDNFWDNHVKPFLTADVEPVLKSFVQQFDSVFGQQALTAALGAVASLALPGASFGAIATGLATTLFSDAKSDASTTAELDATQILQTVQSALQVAKAATNTVTRLIPPPLRLSRLRPPPNMPNWLTWLIALLRSYLGIKADIAAKQQQEVGAVKEDNDMYKDILNEVERSNAIQARDDSTDIAALKLRMQEYKRPD